ncbi:hypothetical protein F7725_017958 [Dissostichus mawsoni]|uniref:Vitamin K-dependent protein C n=1 Tax=Dissostichus mawsoni TaxID=36200 RepID=A0A7J5XQM7_DISMA|nr:hypothetical protein F7725_017958 [Dissostichus mawsoni]
MAWTSCIILFLSVCVCGGRRLPDPEPAMHGGVQSPLYPQPYPPNLQQQWDLSVFYDTKILGKFCGHENSDGHHPGNQPILSPGNRLGLICLNTLGSYLCSCHHGYELRSDQRSLSCSGGTFDEPEGHLFSPGYPDPSPHALSCQYFISVESGFTVALNFTDNFHIESVDTEQGTICPHHWLQVTVADREPWKLCGGKSPGVKCPFSGSVDNGRVTPDLSEYLYRDYIFVRCDQGYKLMTDGKEVEGFSTMCQNNGLWHLPLPECHILDCGEPEPLPNGGVNFLFGSQNQYLSVVQYHCHEPFYSLLGGMNVCGQPTKLIAGFQRIIGGAEAPADTIPWQVLLKSGGRAGGMIFTGLTHVTYMLGSPVLAASIHIHPEYNNPNHVNYNHDIALIKTQDTITFNSSVMPICLPAEDTTYTMGETGLVSGFGMTETDTHVQVLSNKLKYVKIPMVGQPECSRSITLEQSTRANVPGLTDNMFCAGMPEGGKDSCQGDSGGPYATWSDQRFWAAGIVSWGVECGKKGTYGVYTRVANYIDWINKTMHEN